MMSNGKQCSAKLNTEGKCRYTKHNLNKIVVSENVHQNIPKAEEQITETDMSPNSAQAIIVMERNNKEEATDAVIDDASADDKSLYTHDEILSESKLNIWIKENVSAKVSNRIKNKNGDLIYNLNGIVALIRIKFSETYKFYWFANIADCDKFVKYAHANKLECHEVFFHPTGKFFLDIDMKLTNKQWSKMKLNDNLTGDIVNAYESAMKLSFKEHGLIESDFEDLDIAIITRNRRIDDNHYKLSFHLITNLWITIAEAKELAIDIQYQLTKIQTELDIEMINLLKDAIDTQPYHQYGSLSLPGGWKNGCENEIYCEFTIPKQSLYITQRSYFDIDLNMTDYNAEEVKISDVSSKFMKEAMQHLSYIPDYDPKVFDIEGGTIRGNFLRPRRITPSHCSVCDKTHDNDNSLMIIFNEESNNALWKCSHSKSKAKLFFKKIEPIKESDNLSIKFLKSSFDDTTIIEYFLKSYNKYKSYNNILYCFNGSYWIKGSNQYIIDDIDDLYKNLYSLVQSTYQDDDLIKFLKKIMCLRSIKYKETLIKGIIGYVSVRNDLWDLNNDLIGFRNGVYDLLNNTFRAGKYDDYITMIIDYDYALSPTSDLQIVESYFKKIMPIEEERDLLLLLLSTILSGRHLEKFIVCTGVGRNGKDALFTYLMDRVMGPYYYGCNPNAITQKVKSDQNVSISNFNKKRIVITSEPESEDTIKTSMVKALTGSDTIAMRSLYSTDTKVNLNQTLFMLCNEKPALDKSEQAILERLIVIPFRSTFKSKSFMEENDLKEGENNVYQASEHVKGNPFLDKMKLPTFNYLLKWYKQFKQDGYLIQSIPNSIKALNQSYLEESDEFMSWFNSQYEKTTDKNDYLKISDIFKNYSTSEFFFNLSKKEKRNNNKTKFIEKVSMNLSLRIFYKEVAYPYIDGKQVCLRNVITNFKPRQDHLTNDD